MSLLRSVSAGVLASLLVAAASAAEPFAPCAHNKPNDAGLRILVEAVFRNDANTRTVQKTLGWPQTPVAGSADEVDLLAWCRCVHRRRVAALGEELAVAMATPLRSAKYDAWVQRLAPAQQREHVGFLFTTDAICVNESRK